MALIDLTLKNLKFAAVADFSRPFGTKKLIGQNAGSLITEEILNNFALPYDTQRPIEITEDSSTTEVQYNCSLVITGGTTLELGNAQFIGCKATLFNTTVNTITVTDGSNTFEIPSQEVFTLTWNGSKWATLKYQINDIFQQLPFQKSPDYFDNGTWEDVTDLYGGAYFRALGGNSEVWEVLQKEHLPNIYGSYVNETPYPNVGSFNIDAKNYIGAFTNKTNLSKGGGLVVNGFSQLADFLMLDASLMNYGTEEEPIKIYTDDSLKQHVNADNYGIRIWKKTAY